MPELIVAVILGVVEGLTEFLPVSSTGHLILAGHALGFTGERADIFEVVIQGGAMLAVVGLYWSRLRGLLSKGQAGFSGWRGVGLMALTSAPALMLGLLAHKTIKALLFKPFTVALALAVGGVAMLVVERLVPKPRTHTVDELTWKQALGIGLCQCLALWPGMSRAASTIVGGMALGLSRRAATEYSFLAALPIIAAATGYDLLKGIRDGTLHAEDAGIFAVGVVVSAVSAYAAVRGFVAYVSGRTLLPFGVYRIVLAAVVLLVPAAFGAG